MRSFSSWRPWLAVLYGLGSTSGICRAQDRRYADYLQQANVALVVQRDHWRHAGSAPEKRRLAGQLYEAAIRADRPDVAEEAVAGGPLKTRQLASPRRSRRMPLRIVHVFDGVESKLEDDYDDAPNEGHDWLARRITRNALEVWTPTHGWLFDGKGYLLNEACPARQGEDTGREWYGAFLPDGRWVTTDVNNVDNSLVFFSREGRFLRSLSCPELERSAR